MQIRTAKVSVDDDDIAFPTSQLDGQAGRDEALADSSLSASKSPDNLLINDLITPEGILFQRELLDYILTQFILDENKEL